MIDSLLNRVKLNTRYYWYKTLPYIHIGYDYYNDNIYIYHKEIMSMM